MQFNLKKNWLPWTAGTLLAVVFAVSLLLFSLYSRRQHSFTLFFPLYGTEDEIQWEVRRVPVHPDEEKVLRSLADEILLGPADLRLMPIFSRSVNIRSFLFRKGDLYIDFEPDLVLSAAESELSLEESLRLFERSMRFNFRDLKELVFSINGEVFFRSLPDEA